MCKSNDLSLLKDKPNKLEAPSEIYAEKIYTNNC